MGRLTGVNKVLKLTIVGVVLLTIFAIGLGIILQKNNIDNEMVENNVSTTNTDSLLNNNGWNRIVVKKVNAVISQYDDGVALGGANIQQSTIVKLGGIDWIVSYVQNGIITLYALQDVGNITLDASCDNCNEILNEYLNNDFYPRLLESVDYDNFDSYVVETGSKEVLFQTTNIQNVKLSTINNQQIINNNVNTGLKAYIPSAYEVGGFIINNNSPTQRVNSFNQLYNGNEYISSGLWNLSIKNRTSNNGVWLRSTTDKGLTYLDDNGCVQNISNIMTLGVRPAINLLLPACDSNGDILEIVSANSNLVTAMNMTTTLLSGNAGSGTENSPYQISTLAQMKNISDYVNEGNPCSNVYFKLIDNIDMSGATQWIPIGNSSTNVFSGNFDGDGYTISNLSSSSSGLCGVFGYTSGGKIENLGVTESSWSTNNDYAGGIVGYADGTTIDGCYCECGIAGGNYVGGIVGYASSATISNCYNTFGILGSNYIGGIVGSISASSVSNCYNIGTTLATTSTGNIYVGGIVGKITPSSMTVSNCFFSNSTNNNNPSSGTTYGIYIENYSNNSYNMRSIDMYDDAGWSIDDSIGLQKWFISKVLNNGFPVITKFVKNIGVKVRSNTLYSTTANTLSSTASISEGGSCYVNFDNDPTRYTDNENTLIGTNLTFTAAAKTNYRFVGWYVFSVGLDGNPSFNGTSAVSANTSYSVSADDYYYLEARFVEVYTINIGASFGGFTANYADDNAYTIYTDLNHNGSCDSGEVQSKNANITYDKGTDLYISINVQSNKQVNHIGYRYSNNGSYSDANSFNNFWTDVTTSYYYMVVNDNNNRFNGGHYLELCIYYDRIFNLTIATSSFDYNTSATATFSNISGSSTTLTTAGTTSGTLLYDVNNLTASYNYNGYTTELSFSKWTIDYNNGQIDLGSGSGNNISIKLYDSNNIGSCVINNLGDDIYDLTLTARFAMHQYTISVGAEFVGTKANNDDSSVMVKGCVDTSATNSNMTNNSFSGTFDYGTNYIISFLPIYSNGYMIDGLYSGSTSINYSYNTTNYVNVYCTGGIVLTGNITYTIKVEYIQFTVNFNTKYNNGTNVYISTDGDYPTDMVSTYPTNLSNINIYQSLTSSQYIMNSTNNNYLKYGIDTIKYGIGTSTCTNSSYDSQTAPSQRMAQSSYYVFINSEILKTLYDATSIVPLNNDLITVYVETTFKPVGKTITIGCYEENDLNNPINLGVSALISGDVSNLISSGINTATYVMGTSITITASALNIGYKLLGFKIDNVYVKQLSEPTYHNSDTYTFRLNTNTDIKIIFALRQYSVTVTHTEYTDSKSLSDKGVTISINNVSQTLSSVSNSYSLGNFDYNLPVSISYNIIKELTISSETKHIILTSIKLYDTNGNVLKHTYGIDYNSSTTTSTIGVVNFNLNEDITGLKIEFNYSKQQSININIANVVYDSDSGQTLQQKLNGTIVLFKNTTTNATYSVTLSSASKSVELAVGTYDIIFYLPTFSTITYTGDSSGSGSIISNLSLSDTSSITLTITLLNINALGIDISYSGYFG